MKKLKSGMRGKEDGLYDLIKDLPENLIMAEIGCYAGESTLMFLQSGKINTLYAIDPWSNKYTGKEDLSKKENKTIKKVYDNMKWAEDSFDVRVSPYKNVAKLKMTFDSAFYMIPSNLDFIYIDGNHEYEYVCKDIILAINKIKTGGIIAGHDYQETYPGVIQAVKSYFQIVGKIKIYKDTSWLIKM